MPTYQSRPSVNIPYATSYSPLDDEVVHQRHASVSRSGTDGMMLMGEARARMLAERLNADMARARVELVYELRCQQQEQVISRASRIMAKMQENPDNPLMLDGLQASFYSWLQESQAVIRHAMERGW